MEISTETYKLQLAQVEQAIQISGQLTPELSELRLNLKELIALAEDTEEGNAESPTSQEKGGEDPDVEYELFRSALEGHVIGSTVAGADSTTTHDPGSSTVDKPSSRLSNGENTSQSSLDNRGGPSSVSPQLLLSDDNPGLSLENASSCESADCSVESESIEEALQGLIGSCCRVPYKPDWGGTHLMNAAIIGIGEDYTQINVTFLNPTHAAIKLCPFFLEDRCKFTADSCKFSHGYSVTTSEIQEYEEPKLDELKVGSLILAEYDRDGLWYEGTVMDKTEEGELVVQYSDYEELYTLCPDKVVPRDWEYDEDDYTDSSDENGGVNNTTDDLDESDLPVYLWRPPKTLDRMGEWEEHTRGIGSKLMGKMGYVPGQGLGKEGQGRAEPVPILLIPQGVSLDAIMAMKEATGDPDLYDFMKKKKKRKNKNNGQQLESSSTDRPTKTNVFGFLNKTLKQSHKVDLSRYKKNPLSKVVRVSKTDLKSKTDRHINVQRAKTDEEIARVEQELARLRIRKERERTIDAAVLRQITQKISSLESYLSELKSSSGLLSSHMQRKKDRKELSTF